MINQQIIEKIKEIVSIKSVETEGTATMPFGEGLFKVLNFFLNLAKNLGFKTINYDNYIGEVIFGDDNCKDDIAVLCHLDTVPEGKGWAYPPFEATELDGKIYGRGTMDNKSSAIICLYALKKLKDEGFIPSKKIKLIVGCDEESGWKCIEHYKKCATLPQSGFSPDAEFPVIYAEKGIIHLDMRFKKCGIVDIFAGERPNMVCDEAKATIIVDNYHQKCVNVDNAVDNCQKNDKNIQEIEKKCGINQLKQKINVDNCLKKCINVDNAVDNCQKSDKNFKEIICKGKSAHASTPQLGKNALEMLITKLFEENVIDKKVYQILIEDSLHLKDLNDETGYLTLSPNMARVEGDNVIITCDIRYPSTMSGKDILNKIGKEIEYTIISHQLPLYNDINCNLIKTLSNVYKEVMGEYVKPIAIGGGTYARALKNGVGFGPEFIGEESTIHQKDEYISIKHIEILEKMYYLAIKKLSI